MIFRDMVIYVRDFKMIKDLVKELLKIYFRKFDHLNNSPVLCKMSLALSLRQKLLALKNINNSVFSFLIQIFFKEKSYIINSSFNFKAKNGFYSFIYQMQSPNYHNVPGNTVRP